MKPDAKSKKIPAVIYFYLIYQPMRKDVNKKLLFCALCQKVVICWISLTSTIETHVFLTCCLAYSSKPIVKEYRL